MNKAKTPTLTDSASQGGGVALLIASFLANKSPATARTYSSSLSYLFEWMGSKDPDDSFEEFIDRLHENPPLAAPLHQLTPMMCVAFSKWLSKGRGSSKLRATSNRNNLPEIRNDSKRVDMSPQTIKRHWIACRGLIKWMGIHGVSLAHPDPFNPSLVKLPKVSEVSLTRALSAKQVLRLIGVCNPRTKAGKRDLCMIALFFGGGVRMGEAINLKISDIQMSRGGTPYLYLAFTKKGVEDKQVVPEWAFKHILAWKKLREREGALPHDHLLSPLGRAKHNGEQPLHQRTLNLRLKRLAYEARIGGQVSAHVGRATSITQLLDQGKSHREVMRFSRHSSVLMVERYDRGRTSVDQNVGRDLTYEDEA